MLNRSASTNDRDHPAPQHFSRECYELIDAVKESRLDAWEQLVRRYSPLIRYWCHQMDVARDDVPDLQQDIFRAVANGISRFHFNQKGDSFCGWLRTITQNKVRDYFRRKSRRVNAVGGATHQQVLSQIPCRQLTTMVSAEQQDERSTQCNPDLTAMIERVKLEFEPRSWLAFYRTAIDGQQANVIAEELGMTHAAVRKAKSRVLRRLREVLTL